jgi:hypothetical protein
MSHSNSRRLAVLLTALLVSGLLVAPVAVGATDTDRHATAEDDRHATANTATNATDDANAERTKANRRKTVKVDGGDRSNDTVAMAGPSVDVTVYPNGTIVITIVIWDNDGATDNGDDDPNDRALHLRIDDDTELDDGSAARPEYDDLTMTRGAKQGEMMLRGDRGDDADATAKKHEKTKKKHTKNATSEGKKHDKKAGGLQR